MQIIIPMTGLGSRFKNAGYEKLKPFISVHNKPIIEWVVKMFPGDEDKIAFICQKDHLDSLIYMESELKRIAPNSKIFSIDNWEKKGPVFDVLKASSIISNDSPAIICYCDFYMQWDYELFKKDVVSRGCDGSIPCYTGFHPHLIPQKNLYASCKVDKNYNLIEIKEKFSFEKNKENSLHSPGVYYFKTGKILKHYCEKLIEEKNEINGEYYASLPFNYMINDGLEVWCPANVYSFCQWGTPEDLQEYLFWINELKKIKL